MTFLSKAASQNIYYLQIKKSSLQIILRYSTKTVTYANDCKQEEPNHIVLSKCISLSYRQAVCLLLNEILLNIGSTLHLAPAKPVICQLGAM